MKQFGTPPPPFQLTPLFLSNFSWPPPLFVQILKTRTPPPYFRGGGGGRKLCKPVSWLWKKKLLYSPLKKPIVLTRTKRSIPMKKAIQQDQNSLVNFTKESFFVYKHKHYEFIWIITHNSELSLHNCSQSQYDKR